ncbi:response regulator transcription factor [Paenibacillus contaminans]|uniref:DNA-binding response regulator n=1 Tax=Paenibacillus contaminans TaxID=450362 RepID=A0A329M294_9BACL|nr:response regulator transcription factor [Paenibacillus contaminans]RAV14239.1 DNA-binding response regulator [Paenibacillus contaminans]
MRRLLLIEDELNLARFIELELQHADFSVTVAHDGKQGLGLALDEDWDIVLLDVMLPGLNGIEVCRRIRNHKQTPIIMLTARDSVIDRVSGLDSGADDYIAKPFAIEELLARIRVILRRIDQFEDKAPLLSKSGLTVDEQSRTVKKGGTVIELTKREYDLLLMFMHNRNRVLSREQLIEGVWGRDCEAETNVVDVYVRYLRNKLDEPDADSFIQTVRGVGYVMR